MKGPMWEKAKAWSGYTLLGLLLVSVVLSIVNSRAIHSISIEVIDPSTEVRDKAIPGLAKENQLPDYRIEVMRSSGGRVVLGSYINQSAAKTLRWEIQDPIRLRQVTSLRLVEDDKFVNDVIEEVQIEGESFSSERYRYELTIGRTAAAAVDYFFTTPIGMTILIAIGLAIFLYIASMLPL